MHRQHRHRDATVRIGVGAETRHRRRVGRIAQHSGVQRAVVVRAAVLRADIAEHAGPAAALLGDVLEVEGGPVQVAQDVALRNLDHLGDRSDLAGLLGAALGRGLVQRQAVVDAPGQLGLVQRAAGRQAAPQRVRRLVGARMVVAQLLVDHAQIQPEVIGAGAAGQHAAAQQQAVIGLARGVHLGGLGRHAGAPGLAVQQGQLGPGDMLDEDAAQALGVLGRGPHRHPALAEAGTGPGIAGARHDGPALQVLLDTLHGRRAKKGAAMAVQHQLALPVRGNGDQVEGAGTVLATQAAGVGRHAAGAGPGLGSRLGRHEGRLGHPMGTAAQQGQEQRYRQQANACHLALLHQRGFPLPKGRSRNRPASSLACQSVMPCAAA